MNYCGLHGAHVNNVTGGLFEKLVRWAPPVIVSLEHHPEWAWVIDALKGRTFFVGRVHQEREPDFDNPMETGDPHQLARDHVTLCLRQGIRYDAWQGCNERAIVTSDGMKRYSAFDSERARLLARHGMRACIGNFSSGAPGEFALWSDYIEAFVSGKQYGAVLGHHGYGWPRPQDGGKWHPFRLELIYEGCEEHGWDGIPEKYWLPALYTECSVDKGVAPGMEGQLGGFRDVYKGETAKYLDDLHVCSVRYATKPYIIGGAIYCVNANDKQWYGYDMWSEVVEALAQRAEPIYRNVDKVSHSPSAISHGIDASEWQGAKFNWKRVAETGADFAFIRATVGYKADRYLRRNAERAWRAGLFTGFYHYLMPELTPETQAAHFLSQIAPHERQLPMVCDFEQKGLSEEWLRRYLEAIKRLSNGGAQMVYSSWSKIHQMVGYNKRWLSRYPLWVAHWGVQKPLIPTPWKMYEFHQYTSSGRIPGHRGRVDLNRFKGSPDALLRKYG